jgi:hypothetical protein
MGVPPVPFRMTEDQMDIRLRLGRLSALLDIAATPLPGATTACFAGDHRSLPRKFPKEGELMDFGIALPTPADSWKTVKRAEDAGFSTARFYDT